MSERQHPLHSIKFIIDCLNATGMYPGNQRTGRTTALALKALARAIENPGEEFHIIDHENTYKCNRLLAERINQIAQSLDLEKIQVKEESCKIKFG